MANSLGAYQADGSNDIGALEAGAATVTVIATGSTIALAKPTVTGLGLAYIEVNNTLSTAKPVCVGEARIIYKAAATPTIPIEDQNNGSFLKFNTNVRRGLQLVRDGVTTPIIDFDGVRYLLDGDTLWGQGKLIWTRFSLTTLQPLDSTSFIRRYAAHNNFGELLFSGGSTVAPYPLQTTTFPDYYVEPTNGVVYP